MGKLKNHLTTVHSRTCRTIFSFLQTVGSAAANAKRLSPAAAAAAASSPAAFSGTPGAQTGRHLSVVETAVAADFCVLRALVDSGSAA